MKYHRSLAKEGMSICYRLPTITIFLKSIRQTYLGTPVSKFTTPTLESQEQILLENNVVWVVFYFESLIVFPPPGSPCRFLKHFSPVFSGRKELFIPRVFRHVGQYSIETFHFFFHWDLVTLLFFTTVSSHVSNASECFEWKTSM